MLPRTAVPRLVKTHRMNVADVCRMAVAATLAAALVALVAIPAGAATDPGRLTPIVVSPVPQKTIVPVRGTDGRWHVMYELQLTNTLDGPADLRSVTVFDPRTGRTLLPLNAEQLVSGEYLHTLNRTSATTTVFEGNQGRLLILSLSFKSERNVPRHVVQRFEVEGAEPFNGQSSIFRYKAGRVPISQRKTPVLSPPLEGKGWLASNAPPGPTSHINAIIGLDGKPQGAERFAADYIQIDASGRIFTGERTDPESWFGYGAQVTAAGGGVVTAARDGLPDQTPGTMPATLSFDELPGNYIAIRMKGGYTAVYAHFKPGSVRVEAGDRVRAGRRLGLLGNSGASLAPHLHFHIVDGPNVSASDGYPYVFDSFKLAAQSDISGLAVALQGEAGFPARDQMTPVRHRRELPLDFTISDFPARR
jgi:murein DD-endopeptidase MepM/ murein hydrolase activator NlpD